MIALACLGHWYIQLLFGVPALLIIAVMGQDSLRKKLRLRRTSGAAPRRNRSTSLSSQ